MTDDGLTATDMERIMVELSLGIPATESRVPDSAAARSFRERVAPEVQAILDAGHSLDFDGADFPE